MKQPAEFAEKALTEILSDSPEIPQPCDGQCSQHPVFAGLLQRIDKRTKITLWIALALLAQALGWQIFPRIVPVAEAAVRAIFP
jgi:hypothetical protein